MPVPAAILPPLDEELQRASRRLQSIEGFCWFARRDLNRAAELPEAEQRKLCRFIGEAWSKLGEIPQRRDPSAAALAILIVEEAIKRPRFSQDFVYPAKPCTCEPGECPAPGDHQICACPGGAKCPLAPKHRGSDWARPAQVLFGIRETYPTVGDRITEADCKAALRALAGRTGRAAKGAIPKWQRLSGFIEKAGLGKHEPEALRQGVNRLRMKLKPQLDQEDEEYRRHHQRPLRNS